MSKLVEDKTFALITSAFDGLWRSCILLITYEIKSEKKKLPEKYLKSEVILELPNLNLMLP